MRLACSAVTASPSSGEADPHSTNAPDASWGVRNTLSVVESIDGIVAS